MAGIRDLKGNPVGNTEGAAPRMRGPSVPESTEPVDLGAIKRAREAIEARRASDQVRTQDVPQAAQIRPDGWVPVEPQAPRAVPVISTTLAMLVERIDNEIVVLDEHARTLRELVATLRDVAAADADKLERFEQLQRLMGGSR